MQRYETPEGNQELPVGTKRELDMIRRVYDWAKPKADKLESSYEEKPSVATRNALRHYTDILWLCHYAEAEARGDCAHCEARREEIKRAIRTFEARANANDGKLDANEVLRELEFLNKTY